VSGQDVARLVEDMRVLVCVGSGGVGKTTNAALLGLYGASLGKRTLVITIDPARRLANSLGLDELLAEPRPLPREALESAGLSPRAPVEAMMLDLPRSWDDMVHRISGEGETTQRILENRFYRYLSRELPGAQEFIACEALYKLSEESGYDLVVLDTPPTQNALDFLEAPARILGFLDHEGLRSFTSRTPSAAAKIGLRFLDGAAGAAYSVLTRFTGTELLDELADFLYLLKHMYAPLIERTRGFEGLLRAPTTRFLVVTSPAPSPLREARFFHEELERRELGVGAMIVNRVVPRPGADARGLDPDEAAAHLEALGVAPDVLGDVAAASVRAVHEQAALASHDEAAISELLAAAAGGVPTALIPQLATDVHDAERLGVLIKLLFGEQDDA
jgi:anion-transporting  ArsA/GET3 family ATPase